MKKFILILTLLIIVLISVLVFWAQETDNYQYRAYKSEQAAMEELRLKNIEAYFKLADNPVSVSYHLTPALILQAVYKQSGRYDDAIRVVNSFKRDYDYGFCVEESTPVRRLSCRMGTLFIALFESFHTPFDKNNEIAKIYFEKGDYDKSLEYLEKSKEKNPCLKSKIFAVKKDFDSAQKCLLECNLENSERTFYMTKGFLYLQEKKYKEAEAEYKKVINKSCEKRKTCSGNNNIYMGLALIYQEKGDKQKAREYFKKVLEREPYNYKAKINLD